MAKRSTGTACRAGHSATTQIAHRQLCLWCMSGSRGRGSGHSVWRIQHCIWRLSQVYWRRLL